MSFSDSPRASALSPRGRFAPHSQSLYIFTGLAFLKPPVWPQSSSMELFEAWAGRAGKSAHRGV